MDTKVGKWRWGGGGGGVMNWAIGMDMYTLMCIKLMTNKNLLYKKINKIKFKKKSSVSLFIFILDDLSIGVSEVLKSPTIIVLLSISCFIAVSSCLMY